jgi:hypothetical protein
MLSSSATTAIRTKIATRFPCGHIHTRHQQVNRDEFGLCSPQCNPTIHIYRSGSACWFFFLRFYKLSGLLFLYLLCFMFPNFCFLFCWFLFPWVSDFPGFYFWFSDFQFCCYFVWFLIVGHRTGAARDRDDQSDFQDLPRRVQSSQRGHQRTQLRCEIFVCMSLLSGCRTQLTVVLAPRSCYRDTRTHPSHTPADKCTLIL